MKNKKYMKIKKIISWINAIVLTIIALYFIGSLLAWSFNPITWWVCTSWVGRIFLFLLSGVWGYALTISSNDVKVSEKVQDAPIAGHVMAFIMEIMFIMISYYFITTNFIK